MLFSTFLVSFYVLDAIKVNTLDKMSETGSIQNKSIKYHISYKDIYTLASVKSMIILESLKNIKCLKM